MHLEPIAVFNSDTQMRALAPRQGVFCAESCGVLVFQSGKGFEQALRDLDGFERIWILYHFHLNEHWRPTVRPPIPPIDQDRVGVFASRSPYRPNPIGMSCVRLLSVQGLKLHVAETDLLDGTPIFDIKPYIPAADAFPQAQAGWVDRQQADVWNLSFTDQAQAQIHWVLEYASYDLARILQVQLSYNPLDNSRKRVQLLGESAGILSCRTWRAYFNYEPVKRTLEVTNIRTGYTALELEPNSADRYLDKNAHREFCHFFGC